MAKADLRWQRTERNIMEAFEAALADKPLEKVSVTALSRQADINKATFYLHYRDIYDLAVAYARRCAAQLVEEADYADAFFGEPRRFASCFVRDLRRRDQLVRALSKNRLVPFFVDQLALSMHERLSAVHAPDDEREAEIMLSFVFCGFFATVGRYVEADEERLVQVAGDLLEGIKAHRLSHLGEA